MARFIPYNLPANMPTTTSALTPEFLSTLFSQYSPVSEAVQKKVTHNLFHQFANVFGYLNEETYDMPRSILDIGCGYESKSPAKTVDHGMNHPWLMRALMHVTEQPRAGRFALSRVVGLDAIAQLDSEKFISYQGQLNPQTVIPSGLGKFGIINASHFFTDADVCGQIPGVRSPEVYTQEIGLANRKIMKALEPVFDKLLYHGKDGIVLCNGSSYDLAKYDQPDIAEWNSGA